MTRTPARSHPPPNRITAAELDFIINYDIKYRMGKELEADED